MTSVTRHSIATGLSAITGAFTVYGETLTEPEILLPSNKACLRLPGIDGKAKMSKSLGNCIYLSDSEADVKKKIMSMFTDPNHLRVEDPGKVEGNPVFIYLDAFCRPEYFAEFLPDYQNLDELKAHYQRGGLGDVKVKKFLNNVMQAELAPIRARRQEWEKRIPDVFDILKEGSKAAEAKAAETLRDVKASMQWRHSVLAVRLNPFPGWSEMAFRRQSMHSSDRIMGRSGMTVCAAAISVRSR